MRVFRHLEDWTRLFGIARLPYDAWLDNASGHLALALATRHLRGSQFALGILMEVTKLCPDGAAVYKDLACCEALRGNLDPARGWLNEEYRLAPELGKVARVDMDLAAM